MAKETKKNYGWIIAIAVVVVVIMWGVSTYNNLLGVSENVDSKWAQVENNLQRRSDLIPNLVSTVQGYANHEEEVFTQIADARAALAGATTVNETTAADQNLTSALSRLLAITESYPELKANENFLSLQDELAGTENRLSVARKDYNDSVQSYNVGIRRLPTNFIANFMGLSQRDYFEIDDATRAVPEVSFE